MWEFIFGNTFNSISQKNIGNMFQSGYLAKLFSYSLFNVILHKCFLSYMPIQQVKAHWPCCFSKNNENQLSMKSLPYNRKTGFRSSRPEVFLGKDVIIVPSKICSKFTGEHPCRIADLKICQYFRLFMSIICRKFAIKTPFKFCDICT